MDSSDIIFLTLLSASLGLNLFQYLRRKRQYFNQSLDATMLLHDLTRGAGLVKVTRIAPEDVILRSPRGAV